ncbi:hypothetical protein CTAYLR_005796 [Chrysophaeum taylorii]|uniref:Glycosyltransferase 61 catalytic domain-containing protein n=1 Tax=Chrysophaeum taylorii TaxID=2483200 RepID=A0AAD7UN26_9STRA|nr:hypothetical protein CTAYLR_005796 [Chrysophaeum taylorii]
MFGEPRRLFVVVVSVALGPVSSAIVFDKVHWQPHSTSAILGVVEASIASEWEDNNRTQRLVFVKSAHHRVNTQRWAISWPFTPDCAGRWGLWHLFARCLNSIVGAASRAGPREDAALVFYDGRPTCELPQFVERWRPLIESLFPGGVSLSQECVPRELQILSRLVVVPDPPSVTIASEALVQLYRQHGFKAFGVQPAPGRRRRVTHIVRDDTGPRSSHRTLLTDRYLEAAFARRGTGWVRCCDWHRINSTKEAISKVANVDVVLGMHGAGLAHAYWLRDGGVLVDIHSGTPKRANALWFFRVHNSRASYVSFALNQTTLSRRSTIDVALAEGIADCVLAILGDEWHDHHHHHRREVDIHHHHHRYKPAFILDSSPQCPCTKGDQP